jgi:hypothetical protein
MAEDGKVQESEFSLYKSIVILKIFKFHKLV